MAVLTVRNLPDEVHRALRLCAARNKRSTESEVREIPEQRIRMGMAITAIARGNGLTKEDVLALEKAIAEARDKKPAEPLRF